MRVSISSTFDAPAEDVWRRVQLSSTLIYITKGLLRFSGAETFRGQWIESRNETCRLMLFGFIPLWKHQLYFAEIDSVERHLSTQEHGGLVSVWNHQILVHDISNNKSRYEDIVDIEAGLFTPLVWFFAQVLYRYRQKRWKRLLRKVDQTNSYDY